MVVACIGIYGTTGAHPSDVMAVIGAEAVAVADDDR